MKAAPMKAVRVIWNDAHTRNDWHQRGDHDTHGPHAIESAGFLVRQDEKGITIAQSRNRANGDIGDTLFIPASGIALVEELG